MSEPVHAAIDPQFKWVLIAVVGLTVLSLLAAIFLALVPDNPGSDQVAAVIKTCTTVFNAGVGAVIGLLGGKAL